MKNKIIVFVLLLVLLLVALAIGFLYNKLSNSTNTINNNKLVVNGEEFDINTFNITYIDNPPYDGTIAFVMHASRDNRAFDLTFDITTDKFSTDNDTYFIGKYTNMQTYVDEPVVYGFNLLSITNGNSLSGHGKEYRERIGDAYFNVSITGFSRASRRIAGNFEGKLVNEDDGSVATVRGDFDQEILLTHF